MYIIIAQQRITGRTGPDVPCHGRANHREINKPVQLVLLVQNYTKDSKMKLWNELMRYISKEAPRFVQFWKHLHWHLCSVRPWTTFILFWSLDRFSIFYQSIEWSLFLSESSLGYSWTWRTRWWFSRESLCYSWFGSYSMERNILWKTLQAIGQRNSQRFVEAFPCVELLVSEAPLPS